MLLKNLQQFKYTRFYLQLYILLAFLQTDKAHTSTRCANLFRVVILFFKHPCPSW